MRRLLKPRPLRQTARHAAIISFDASSNLDGRRCWPGPWADTGCLGVPARPARTLSELADVIREQLKLDHDAGLHQALDNRLPRDGISPGLFDLKQPLADAIL